MVKCLENANQNVSNLSIQLTSEHLATSITTGGGLKTRGELDAAYDTMVQMLNALCLVNGDTQYKATFELINARIKHYQDVLAQRKGKADSEKEEDEEVEGGRFRIANYNCLRQFNTSNSTRSIIKRYPCEMSSEKLLRSWGEYLAACVLLINNIVFFRTLILNRISFC